MITIRNLDAASGLLVAEAGVILAEFDDVAREVGRRSPLTLGTRETTTIGGLVSTNAGGTHCCASEPCAAYSPASRRAAWQLVA